MTRLKKARTFLSNWFALPWYPIALGAFPVLALLSANAGQVQAMAGSRILLLSHALAAILFSLCRLVLRHAHPGMPLFTPWEVREVSLPQAAISVSEKFPDM